MRYPLGFVGGAGWSRIWKGEPDAHVPRPAWERPSTVRPEVRAEQRKRAQRKRRAKARADGLCICCFKREPKPECVVCVHCLGVNSEDQDRRRARKREASNTGR